MSAYATASNCVLHLHRKLQKSTLKVKKQLLTTCLGSNWMSMGSFFFFLFGQFCYEYMCSCKFHWNIFNASSALYWLLREPRVQKSAQIHYTYHRLLTNFDMKTEILTNCIWWKWKDTDHSCKSLDFKFFWATAQCPACTAEYPGPIRNSYIVEM